MKDHGPGRIRPPLPPPARPKPREHPAGDGAGDCIERGDFRRLCREAAPPPREVGSRRVGPRGPGGFRLTRSPEAMTVGDAVRALGEFSHARRDLPAIHGRREPLRPQQELRFETGLEHGELPHPEALRQPPPRDPAPGRARIATADHGDRSLRPRLRRSFERGIPVSTRTDFEYLAVPPPTDSRRTASPSRRWVGAKNPGMTFRTSSGPSPPKKPRAATSAIS